MSLKSKAKAAKKREQLKAQRERDIAKDLAKVQEMKTRTSGFAKTERKDVHKQAFEASKMPVYPKQHAVQHARSEAERFDLSYGNKRPAVMGEASEDMLKREEQAREDARKFKARIGPAYNKGPIVLLSEGEIEAEKRGELRRRS